jgi:hypothetical protein
LVAAGLPNDEVRTFTSYSLRRFLPSVAEVVRTPPEVARHLGNRSESVFQSHHQGEPMHMSQLYADDFFLTAARTKSLLPGVVVASSRLHGSDASLQKVRSDGWTWARVLQELVSHNACTKAGPSKAQLASEADKGCGSDWDGFSLSSDTASSSSSLASDHDLSWFRLPRGVAHLVKDRSQALSLSFSRSLLRLRCVLNLRHAPTNKCNADLPHDLRPVYTSLK